MESSRLSPQARPTPSPRKAFPPEVPLPPQAIESAGELAFTRLGCTLCSESFLLDVEDYWNRVPEEMETVGRKFLGVPVDALLCPRCLHEVETAGAERIYWSLACA